MYPPAFKTIACNLRNKPERYSIRCISDLLEVPKSTIHRWISVKSNPERKKRNKCLISYEKVIRSYGYSNVGEKCIVKNKAGLKKYSLLLAISMKKILSYEIETTNFNRHNFYVFLKKKLLPIIKNKVIIMDNASFHHCKEITSLIRRSGNEILFVPPYSPQYNPIEIMFRMLKSRLCLLSEIEINDISRELSLISKKNLKAIFKSCLT